MFLVSGFSAHTLVRGWQRCKRTTTLLILNLRNFQSRSKQDLANLNPSIGSQNQSRINVKTGPEMRTIANKLFKVNQENAAEIADNSSTFGTENAKTNQ